MSDKHGTGIHIVEWVVAAPTDTPRAVIDQRRQEAMRGLEIAFDNGEELISVVPVSGSDWGMVVYTFRHERQ